MIIFMVEIKELKASCINCYEEDDVLTIGVGDDANDPKNFIIIGRFDEDELPVNECIGFQSDATEYEIADAIQSVQLDTDKLVIVLNDAAANKVGVREYHAVISKIKDAALLTQYLQKVFDGSDVNLQLP